MSYRVRDAHQPRFLSAAKKRAVAHKKNEMEKKSNPEKMDESAFKLNIDEIRARRVRAAEARRAGQRKFSREQFRELSRKRLTMPEEALMVMEMILTNKTNTFLAREAGISISAVCRRRRRLVEHIREMLLSGQKLRLYRRNGELFFDIKRDEQEGGI